MPILRNVMGVVRKVNPEKAGGNVISIRDTIENQKNKVKGPTLGKMSSVGSGKTVNIHPTTQEGNKEGSMSMYREVEKMAFFEELRKIASLLVCQDCGCEFDTNGAEDYPGQEVVCPCCGSDDLEKQSMLKIAEDSYLDILKKTAPIVPVAGATGATLAGIGGLVQAQRAKAALLPALKSGLARGGLIGGGIGGGFVGLAALGKAVRDAGQEDTLNTLIQLAPAAIAAGAAISDARSE